MRGRNNCNRDVCGVRGCYDAENFLDDLGVYKPMMGMEGLYC